ncbi:MAG: hypothetical protein LBT13_01015, partial [Treponema sp.]|nr:hypothetical protein [Treponema sp.]
MKAKKKLLSPGRIFIFYILAAGLSIIVFRFLVPGDPEPLPIYARSWRLTQGLLNFISLFPALAMTGLVIPFGLQKQKEEQYPRFSPQLLDQFKGPIITAISAVVCYGVLFFWVFPLVQDYETKLLVEGNLFTRSKEKALEYAEKSAWPEVSQLIATCERIWPESPELESIKTEAAIGMDQWRITQATVRAYALAEEEYHFNDDWISEHSEERKPVTVAEALVLANTALKEMRYYDAHWLANLGLRLASQNSREAREAAGIASRAWDGITRVESSLRDTDEAALYHLKRDGYDAMNSEDWIRAYYLFKEFFVKRPGDPDVARFLPISEQGIAKVA